MADLGRLEELAKLVRYFILKMTTAAGSGHPTSSLSAADVMVALFFDKLMFDFKNPDSLINDRVIFSKGHVSPLIYALYAAAGAIDAKELEKYRQFGSDLEGHPTKNFRFAEAATGSLGQGLSIGVGMALALRAQISNFQSPISNKFKNKKSSLKINGKLPIVYVLMGDSETAEGSVWEACELASYYKLGNLVGIIDVNRLGQSGPTMFGWDTDTYRKRVEAFGWEASVIDGHDFAQIDKAFNRVGNRGRKPLMIIAKTVKGKGVSFLENKEGWHGKALRQDEFEKAVEELGDVDLRLRGKVAKPINAKGTKSTTGTKGIKSIISSYKLGDEIATRKAFGEALAALGEIDHRIVSLDAEVKNSTFSEIFKEKFPDRFFEMFIAEQNMVGAAIGMAKRGRIPFVSTFATFFTRAFDQIRMGAYGGANVKFVGSHAGVSIGEDGPSQMGLEDFAQFRAVFGSVVLCPGDGVATWKLVQVAKQNQGIYYIRTNRPATPVIYKESEKFEVGGSKVVKSSKDDRLTIVACGVALIEAVAAAEELSKKKINVRVIDAYSIKPIDEVGLRKAAGETNNLVITVEDHYPEGGLGDAVLNVFTDNRGRTPKGVGPLSNGRVQVHKLAVYKMPRSGKMLELLDYEGISAKEIIKKVLEVAG